MGGDVRGAAFKVKAPLEHPRKPVLGLGCIGRLTKKDLESGLQASLPSIFQAPFSIRFADAITRCVIGLPHC